MTDHPDATAWHEAGHALMAHLLGAEVRIVTLESELDDHEGHSEIAWSGALTADERARRSALTAIAGPIAELAFRGEDDLEDPTVLATWQNDWRELEECVRAIEADPLRHVELQRALVLEVRTRFDDPETHERLARIADMLSAHGTLDETLFEDAVS